MKVRQLAAILMAWHLLSSASVWAAPCHIEVAEIRFVGEVHESEEAKRNRAIEIDRAEQGLQVLALEGIPFGQHEDGAAHTLGFDDPFTLGLARLIRIHFSLMNLSHMKISAQSPAYNSMELKVITLHEYQNNPFVQEAWQLMRAQGPLPNLIEEDMAKAFEDLQDAKDLDGHDEAVKSLFLQDSPESDLAFTDLVQRLARSYIEMAASPKYSALYQTPANLNLALDSLSGQDTLSWIQPLAIDWRNIFLARNLAELYCQAKQDQKPLVVIVGEDHIPGLRQILKTME